MTTAQILGSGTPGGDVNMVAANELGQAVSYTSGTPGVAFIGAAALVAPPLLCAS